MVFAVLAMDAALVLDVKLLAGAVLARGLLFSTGAVV